MPSQLQVAGDLLDYLNSNLLTLSEYVYVETFTIVLEELWEAVSNTWSCLVLLVLLSTFFWNVPLLSPQVLRCIRYVLAPPIELVVKLEPLKRSQLSLLRILLEVCWTLLMLVFAIRCSHVGHSARILVDASRLF